MYIFVKNNKKSLLVFKKLYYTDSKELVYNSKLTKLSI